MLKSFMAAICITWAGSMLLAENLITNGNFENGLDNWSVPEWYKNAVTPEIDNTEMPGPGKGSLRIVGEKERRGIVICPVTLPSDAKKFRMSVFMKTKDLETGLVSAYLSMGKAAPYLAPLQTPHANHGGKDTKWTRYETFFELPEGARTKGYLCLGMSSLGTLGTAWFDNVELEAVAEIPSKEQTGAANTVKNPISVVYDGGFGVFEKGEKPFLDLVIKNPLRKEQTAVLAFTVSDYFGNKAGAFTKTVTTTKEPVTKFRLDLPTPEKVGFQGVTLKRNEQLGSEELKFSYLIVDKVPTKPDPVFGITFYAQAERNSRAMRLLAVGTKGVSVDWNVVDKSGDGNYDWSKIDKEINACREAGLKVVGAFRMLGVRGGTDAPALWREHFNKCADKNENPYNDEYYAAAARFEKAAVERYKDVISEWSGVSEINLLKDYPFEYDHFVKRTRIAARIVKEANPKATFVGIGCSGQDGRAIPSFPVMRDFWENQKLYECLDGVGLDQYTAPQTFGPGFEPANSETGRLRDIMLDAIRIVKSKGKHMISIDEKGFNILQSLPPDSPYAVDMANVIARDYVIVKSLPEVGHWLYFRFSPYERVFLDWGLFSYDGPRPAAAAYAGVARILAHAEFVDNPAIHKNVPCYIFKKDGKTLAALWCSGTDSSTMLADIPGKVELYDVQGNPFKIERNEFKLTAAPIYVVCDASPREVVDALKKSDIDQPELSAALNISKSGEVELLAHNLTNKELPVTVDVSGTKQEGIIAGGEVKVFTAPCPDMRKPVTATLKTVKGRSYPVTGTFALQTVPRVNSMEQLRGLKPLEILNDGEKHLSNIDFISNRVWKGPGDCSAEVRIGYDDVNFYMNVRVTDDIHVNRQQPCDLWSGDSVQFAFDFNRDAKLKKMKGKTGLFDDDVLFCAGLTESGPRLFCDVSSDPAVHNKELAKPVITRDEKSRTTDYSIVMPWELTRFKPEKNRVIGFDVIVLDTDKKDQMPLYWMQITPGIAGGQRPDLYAGFILE